MEISIGTKTPAKIKDEKLDEDYEVLSHINQPFLLAKYKKADTLDEIVIILVPMITGATNIRFHVSENGTEAYIRYNWPNPMFNISSVFKKDGGKEIPKIVALQEQLINHRESQYDTPDTTMTIRLPFAVQTNSAEHIVTGFEDKESGCKLLRIELPAIKKYYSHTITEIKFEKKI